MFRKELKSVKRGRALYKNYVPHIILLQWTVYLWPDEDLGYYTRTTCTYKHWRKCFISLPPTPPPSLDGMQVYHEVTPSIYCTGTHLYTWLEQGTVRAECLDQGHNITSLLRAPTSGQLDTELRTLTRRPMRLHRGGGMGCEGTGCEGELFLGWQFFKGLKAS